MDVRSFGKLYTNLDDKKKGERFQPEVLYFVMVD